MSESRLPALCELYEHLKEQGYDHVDSIILNKEDEYISRTEDGSRYIVKRWFSGRECDVRRTADILERGESGETPRRYETGAVR